MSVPVDESSRADRWKAEAEFFDQQMTAEAKPLDPRVLERYQRLRRRRFHKEFRFRLLGDLRGKTVLDAGCGDGVNSILFAAMGAQVTGIDISPKSIKTAQQQAELNSLAANSRFLCAPLETAEFAPESFDIVWADAFLHHVIDDLDAVIAKLLSWVKPGGYLVLGEPVNLAPWLRRLRLGLPVAASGTPDERPLEATELAVIERRLPGLRQRAFSFFMRFERFVLKKASDYERSPALRKAIINAFALADYALLSLPGARRLAGFCVMYARKP